MTKRETHERATDCSPASMLVASWLDVASSPVASAVGGKALGLLRIPREWTPPFLVLTDAFTKEAREHGATQTFLALGESDRHLVAELLRTADEFNRPGHLFGPTGLFVRSNALDEEGVGARGAYPSMAVPTNLADIAKAVDELVAISPNMRVLLQIAVDGINGYLSNERRVSEALTIGLVEGLDPSRAADRRTIKAGKPHEGSLLADSVSEVEDRLRNVLGWLNTSRGRQATSEWVWDGTRLWIVQLDEAPAQNSDPIAEAYLRAKASRSSRTDLPPSRGLRFFLDVDQARWKKLPRAGLFNRLGLPTADIFVSTGTEWSDCGSAQLAAGLLEINNGLWVVRTDVATTCALSEDLLPTSGPSADPELIASSMDRAANFFAENGVPPDEWALLSAPLVSTHVSAMAYARTETSDVQVDALWGFPDGLLYLPHDTYMAAADGSVSSIVRYKPACLLFNDGSWRTLRLGPPRDRAPTLNSDEVRLIADWARTMASQLSEPVRLMVLARIGGQRGADACLPFHYTRGRVQPPRDTESHPRALRGVITIRGHADLDLSHISGQVRGLAIEPHVELARDTALIRLVAETARDMGVPVFFEGSLLAHAYHVMSATGAAVIPLDPSPLTGTVVEHGKLVRDAIPAIIERSGSVARVRPLAAEEALPLLKRKLIEEAFEVHESVGPSVVDELADVREVLEALEHHVPGGRDVVEEAMQRKRRERGAFRDLVFLEATAERPVDAPSGWDPAIAATEQGVLTVAPTPDALGAALVQFVLPLVPPTTGVLRRSASLDESHDLELVVRFNGARAEVRLNVLSRQDPLQLSLFDAAEQESTQASGTD